MRPLLVLFALCVIGCRSGNVTVSGGRAGADPNVPPPTSQPGDPHPPPGAHDPGRQPVAGEVAATNGPAGCDADPQCPRGHVCEKCGDQGTYVPGCRVDADCAPTERCEQVACIRCPCPALCQAL